MKTPHQSIERRKINRGNPRISPVGGVVRLVALRQRTEQPGHLSPDGLVKALARSAGVATEQKRHAEQAGFAFVLRQKVCFLTDALSVNSDEVTRRFRRRI